MAVNLMAVNLLLAGCGKMGGALLDGWLAAGSMAAGSMVGRVDVVEPQGVRPDGAPDGGADPRLFVCADPSDLPGTVAPDVVIFAVKPQVMAAVVPAYRRFVRPETVFLSIAAGKTIGFFQRHLGDEAAIVRSMPNTPAAVGRGMTVACPSASVSTAQSALCDTLLRAVGDVAWIGDEGLFDAVTAVSGSGPAYVFLLIEAMAKAGVAAGLPEDLALRLARATVVGSGELARQSAEPAARLRENVTSPGGTTQAALGVLMAPDGMQPLFDRAIAAAAARSRELARSA